MPSDQTPNRQQLQRQRSALSQDGPYQAVFRDASKIIDAARESAAESVNAASSSAQRRAATMGEVPLAWQEK